MKRRKTTSRKTSRKTRTTKKKLVGYTKVKGKYKLVYKKGGKPSLGRSSYSSKKTLIAAAKRALKK